MDPRGRQPAWTSPYPHPTRTRATGLKMWSLHQQQRELVRRAFSGGACPTAEPETPSWGPAPCMRAFQTVLMLLTFGDHVWGLGAQVPLSRGGILFVSVLSHSCALCLWPSALVFKDYFDSWVIPFFRLKVNFTRCEIQPRPHSAAGCSCSVTSQPSPHTHHSATGVLGWSSPQPSKVPGEGHTWSPNG